VACVTEVTVKAVTPGPVKVPLVILQNPFPPVTHEVPTTPDPLVVHVPVTMAPATLTGPSGPSPSMSMITRAFQLPIASSVSPLTCIVGASALPSALATVLALAFASARQRP